MKRIIDILIEIHPEFDFANSENFIEDGFLDSFDMITLPNPRDNYPSTTQNKTVKLFGSWDSYRTGIKMEYNLLTNRYEIPLTSVPSLMQGIPYTYYFEIQQQIYTSSPLHTVSDTPITISGKSISTNSEQLSLNSTDIGYQTKLKYPCVDELWTVCIRGEWDGYHSLTCLDHTYSGYIYTTTQALSPTFAKGTYHFFFVVTHKSYLYKSNPLQFIYSSQPGMQSIHRFI